MELDAHSVLARCSAISGLADARLVRGFNDRLLAARVFATRSITIDYANFSTHNKPMLKYYRT